LKAIVFDLDDTLYPERAYVINGFRAVAALAERELGLAAEQCFEELQALFEAGARERTFDTWLRNHGIDPAVRVRAMVRWFRNHEPRISLFPGVLELLSDLRSRHALGLLTDGHSAVQRRKVAALEIARFFDAVVFTDDFGIDHWKPSTQPFALILERLGTAGAEAAYVADNPIKDFVGARAEGMFTIRVRSPLGLYSHLEPPSPTHAPDAEIEDLSDLARLIHHMAPKRVGSAPP